MPSFRLGILLWNQATSWSDQLVAARLVDRLGYDHLWSPSVWNGMVRRGSRVK